MATRKWHFTTALGNTFKDIWSHPASFLGTSALFALPIPLSAVVAYFGLGGEIQWMGSRTSALAIALYIVGLLTASIATQFALMRAVRSSAIGEEVKLSQTIGSLTEGGFGNFVGAKLLYEGLKVAVIGLGFIPAIGAIVFSLQGSGGRLENVFRGPVIVVFLLGILVGIALALGLLLAVALTYGLTPAVGVLETSGPFGSFRRSRDLLAGRRLDFFMLLFLRNLVLQIPSIAFIGPTYIAQLANVPERAATMNFRSVGMGMTVAEGERLSIVLLTSLGLFLFYVFEGPIIAGTWANYYLAVRSEEAVSSAAGSSDWRLSLSDSSSSLEGPRGSSRVQDRGYPGEQENPSGDDEPTGNL